MSNNEQSKAATAADKMRAELLEYAETVENYSEKFPEAILIAAKLRRIAEEGRQ